MAQALTAGHTMDFPSSQTGVFVVKLAAGVVHDNQQMSCRWKLSDWSLGVSIKADCTHHSKLDRCLISMKLTPACCVLGSSSLLVLRSALDSVLTENSTSCQLHPGNHRLLLGRNTVGEISTFNKLLDDYLPSTC